MLPAHFLSFCCIDPMDKITVFCASSNQVAPAYYEAIEELGKILASELVDTWYGGGKAGLMGRLAESVLKQGGTITGVLPEFMKAQQWFNPSVTRLIWVSDMHERKKILLDQCSAVVCMPGGVGTLDELFEAISLKQLGQLNAPIIMVNTLGFFNPILQLFDKMIGESFMREVHRNMWTVVDGPREVLKAIASAPLWDAQKNIKLAQV
jgi:uncharacterized protein (TIGR00730 family)